MSNEHWPPPHDPTTCPDCIRARTPLRLQSDSATYVEGREAPEGDALVGAGAYPPRSARREGREAPRREVQEPDIAPWYDDNDHGGAARRIARSCIHGAEVAEVVDPGHGFRPWWRLVQTHEHGDAATWDAAVEACCAALARTVAASASR